MPCGGLCSSAWAPYSLSTCRQPFPGRQRKTARFRHAGREGARGQEFAHAAVLEHGAAALAQAQRRLLRAGAPGRAAPGRVLRPLGHEAAAAHAPQDEALHMQLAVGRLHRVARHAQRPGQRARGGQGTAGLQRAVQDQLAHGPVDARVQRQGAVGGSPTQALTDSSCACLNIIGLDLCEKVVGNSQPFQDYKSGYRFMPAAPSPGTPFRPCLPSVRIPRSLERSRPPRRRRADLGHRQLRRHLHPGVPGRQGCRPESGADGLLGLVGLDRGGRDRAGPELGAREPIITAWSTPAAAFLVTALATTPYAGRWAPTWRRRRPSFCWACRAGSSA